MSGLDKNRKRKYTIAFRVSEEERASIYAKIYLASVPIGEYMRNAALTQGINVYAGKYESDRLAVELKRLGQKIDTATNSEAADPDILEILLEIRETLKLLQEKNKSL